MSLTRPTPLPNGHPKHTPTKISHPSDQSREPFHRLPTSLMRDRLIALLGPEDGWVWWDSLKGFLTGRLGRREWEDVCGAVLETALKRHLHNQFLTSLLHNSSTLLPHTSTPLLPLPTANQPATLPSLLLLPSTTPKRARSPSPSQHSHDLPKRARVRQWALGMSRGERDRLKRRGGGLEEEEEEAEEEDEVGGGEGRKEWSELRRGWGGKGRETVSAIESTALSQFSHLLPTPAQMQQRMDAIARDSGLDGAGEGVGEAMVFGMEAHLETVLHSSLHLTRTDRPTASTIHLIPPNSPTSAPKFEEHIDQAVAGPSAQLTPELTLKNLASTFTLAPHLHPHQGGAVWKLGNGVWAGEEEEERVVAEWAVKRREEWEMAKARLEEEEKEVEIGVSESEKSKDKDGVDKDKDKEKLPPPETYEEYIRREMEKRGVLKVALEPGAEGGGKKDALGRGGKKDESTHWGYVDPSDLLRDVFG